MLSSDIKNTECDWAEGLALAVTPDVKILCNSSLVARLKHLTFVNEWLTKKGLQKLQYEGFFKECVKLEQ